MSAYQTEFARLRREVTRLASIKPDSKHGVKPAGHASRARLSALQAQVDLPRTARHARRLAGCLRGQRGDGHRRQRATPRRAEPTGANEPARVPALPCRSASRRLPARTKAAAWSWPTG